MLSNLSYITIGSRPIATDYFFNFFSKQRHYCKALEKSLYLHHVNTVQIEIKSNCKKFWKYANVRNRNYELLIVMILDSEVATSEHKIVNLFASHFQIVCCSINCSSIFNHITALETFKMFSFTAEEVGKALNDISDSLCPGPEGIPVIFIKKLYHLLVNPLIVFLNASLRLGYFPSTWSNSYTSPVHKKGSRDLIGNYRAITKVSLFPKIFDELVETKLYDYFGGLIIREQHSFIPRRFTVSNLLKYNELLVNCGNNGKQID